MEVFNSWRYLANGIQQSKWILKVMEKQKKKKVLYRDLSISPLMIQLCVRVIFEVEMTETLEGGLKCQISPRAGKCQIFLLFY